jgi:hypothetical protein
VNGPLDLQQFDENPRSTEYEKEMVMGALVVYESMYGNTQQIAEAVGAGLSSHLPVEVVEVASAPSAIAAGVELLVVGAPTHVLGLSRETTRADAAERSEHDVISTGIGLREWLETAAFPSGLAVASFDTKADKRWLPGSAAAVARRQLRRLGCRPVAAAESFYVEGMEGPLASGEVARARTWGASLAGHVATADA